MSWLFAQVYERMTRHESRHIQRAREQLIAGLRGEILEVGVGNGLNLRLYPAEARVTATDHSPHMLRKAEARARDARAEVELRHADVQSLPFEADRFDHAVAGLVFCSVDDPERGLRELSRVTRPGGEVRLLEHVGAAGGWTRRGQTALTPIWRRLADGCRLNRDTANTVERAGLRVEEVITLPGLPRFLPFRLIRARKPPRR